MKLPRVLMVGLIIGAANARPSPLAPRHSGPKAEATTGWLAVDPTALPFRHDNGASGEKYLVETMGAGVVLFDLEGDGDFDVYLVNGAPLPGSPAPREPPGNVLFRNEGRRSFTDVTAAAGIGDTGYGMGGCAGDIDNDGDVDLYVTNFGADVLYRNRGDGSFRREALPPLDGREWSSSCSFGDLDADGFLDLYVVHYLDFALDNHKYCGRLEPGYRVYCEPEVYDGVPDSLYWNDEAEGHGFRPGSLDAAAAAGNGLGVIVADLDRDSRLDVYVANDRTPNTLWLNRGDRRLEEAGLVVGVAMSGEGVARAGMGVDAGDVDGDGAFDMVVTNFSREANALFRTLAPGLFVDDAASMGLTVPSLLPLGFGVNLFDLENDGDLDLFVANGHVTDNIELYQSDLRHRQPDQLFLNDGRGRLEVVGPERIGDLATPRVSRGSAVGDLDEDGRLDLVVTHSAGPALVFWNEHPGAPGATTITLVGRQSARQPFGASIRTEENDGSSRTLLLRGASGYLSQGPDRIYLGLDETRPLRALEVLWPSGQRERYPGAFTDKRAILQEGKGVPAER